MRSSPDQPCRRAPGARSCPEAEAEIARLTARLAAAEQLAALGARAGAAAHELNNPLSYVLANLRYALDETPAGGAGGDLRDALAEALLGAERVQRIAREIAADARAAPPVRPAPSAADAPDRRGAGREEPGLRRLSAAARR